MASKAFVRAKWFRAFIHAKVLEGRIPNGGAGKLNVPDGSFQPYTDSMESHRMMAAGHRADYFAPNKGGKKAKGAEK